MANLVFKVGNNSSNEKQLVIKMARQKFSKLQTGKWQSNRQKNRLNETEVKGSLLEEDTRNSSKGQKKKKKKWNKMKWERSDVGRHVNRMSKRSSALKKCWKLRIWKMKIKTLQENDTWKIYLYGHVSNFYAVRCQEGLL